MQRDRIRVGPNMSTFFYRLDRLKLNLYLMFRIAVVTVAVDCVSTAVAFFFVPSLESKEGNWLIRLLWPKMGFWIFPIVYVNELLIITFISAVLLFLAKEFEPYQILKPPEILFNFLAFFVLFYPLFAGLGSWWL